MNDTHVNESILSEEILEDQKKNRIDHMTYLPGMEDIGSEIMDQVIEAMEAYDYSKYTAADGKMHLHIRNVPRRISVRCYHRQPFRFWKRLPRQLRRRQENILETVFICSHRFILQTIVKTIVFIVDLTVTIRSTAHS